MIWWLGNDALGAGLRGALLPLGEAYAHAPARHEAALIPCSSRIILDC